MCETFGEYIRAVRIGRRETLRNFCKHTGLDSAYASKLERGILPAPEVEGGLEDLANAYGIERRGEKYAEFCRLASESRNEDHVTRFSRRKQTTRREVDKALANPPYTKDTMFLILDHFTYRGNYFEPVVQALDSDLGRKADTLRGVYTQAHFIETTENKPREMQKELLSAISDVILDDRAKPLAFCTHRRSGKTEALLVAAKWIAEAFPKYRIHYFCPAPAMQEDVYTRFLSLLEPNTYYVKDDRGNRRVTLSNGSVVLFISSRKSDLSSRLRGVYPNLTIIDEAHLMDDADYDYAIKNWEETYLKQEYYPVTSKVVAVGSLGGKRRSIFSDTIRSEDSYYGKEWTRKVFPISKSVGKDISQEEVDSWKKQYSIEDWQAEFGCIPLPKSVTRVTKSDPKADLEYAVFEALYSMNTVAKILKRRGGDDSMLGDALSRDEECLAKSAKDYGLSLKPPKTST
jgi:transcriptional regulator with XRE-family HTH domain